MRTTINSLRIQLDALNEMTEALGLDRYELYEAYDTVALMMSLPDGGFNDVSSARGNREVYHLIRGMIIGMSEATKALRP